MEAVLESLPQRPVSVRRIFDLMEPPRAGVGIAWPYLANNDDDVVAAYVEYEGDIRGIIFENGSWKPSETTESNLNRFIHYPHCADRFCDSFKTEAKERISHGSLSPVHVRTQTMAPAGFQTKLCIEHRQLDLGDIEQLDIWPQIAQATPTFGVPNFGIIAVTVAERQLSGSTVVLFMYFNPDIESWRVVDTCPSDASQDVLDSLHGETEKTLLKHYDFVEMLYGPQ